MTSRTGVPPSAAFQAQAISITEVVAAIESRLITLAEAQPVEFEYQLNGFPRDVVSIQRRSQIWGLFWEHRGVGGHTPVRIGSSPLRIRLALMMEAQYFIGAYMDHRADISDPDSRTYAAALRAIERLDETILEEISLPRAGNGNHDQLIEVSRSYLWRLVSLAREEPDLPVESAIFQAGRR